MAPPNNHRLKAEVWDMILSLRNSGELVVSSTKLAAVSGKGQRQCTDLLRFFHMLGYMGPGGKYGFAVLRTDPIGEEAYRYAIDTSIKAGHLVEAEEWKRANGLGRQPAEKKRDFSKAPTMSWTKLGGQRIHPKFEFGLTRYTCSSCGERTVARKPTSETLKDWELEPRVLCPVCAGNQ